jgi:hypothetical protein
MLATFLAAKGFTRFSPTWLWSKLVALAFIVAAAGPDFITSKFAWLGMPLTPVECHWVLAGAVTVLWLAGKYDASPLPSSPQKTS